MKTQPVKSKLHEEECEKDENIELFKRIIERYPPSDHSWQYSYSPHNKSESISTFKIGDPLKVELLDKGNVRECVLTAQTKDAEVVLAVSWNDIFLCGEMIVKYFTSVIDQVKLEIQKRIDDKQKEINSIARANLIKELTNRCTS